MFMEPWTQRETLEDLNADAGGETPRQEAQTFYRSVERWSRGRQSPDTARLSSPLPSRTNQKMDNPILYSKAHTMQQRDSKKFLDLFWQKLNWSPDDDILDFGCGDGDTTRILLADAIPQYNQLVGVDIVHDMVDHAKKHHAVHNPRLTFRQMDIINDKVEEIFPRGFDKIFSFYCMHWIRDHKTLMEKMFRLTKPGGQLLLLIAGAHPFFTIWDQVSKYPQWAGYMKEVKNLIPTYHYDMTLTEQFSEASTNAGFEIIQCETLHWSYTYESPDDIMSAEVAVNPFLKVIPRELHEAYYNDKWTELQKVTTQSEDGAVTVCYQLTGAFLRRPA